jgi:hypothetical protein
MDDETFWSLVAKLDWGHEGDDEEVVEPVVEALSHMSEAEIAGFQNTLARKLYALDGRAWARESGETVWWGEPARLSVDGFLYARCVVVANGPEFYRAVLEDPTKTPKDMDFESLLYVAPTAYERKTGDDGDAVRDLIEEPYETFSNEAGWR